MNRNGINSFESRIEDEEELQLDDILETVLLSEFSKNIEENIKYILNRENFSYISVSVRQTETSESALMGLYTVVFNDGEYTGNFISRANVNGDKVKVLSLSIGSQRLHYFGD